MPRARTHEPFVLADAVLVAFDTNQRMNEYLIEHLSDAVWRAEPPGGKGRTIAAIVAHMHNVRLMWLKVSAKNIRLPAKLDRFKVTKAQAVKALQLSHDALVRLIEPSITGDGRIPNFRPDVAGFIGYLMTHDAHHRGQLCMQTRWAGEPLSAEVSFGMWDWGKRGKQ